MKLFLTACSSASAGPRDPYRYLEINIKWRFGSVWFCSHLMGWGFSLSIACRRGVKILQASANSSLLQHFTHSDVRGAIKEAMLATIELIDHLTKCIWEPTKTSRMRRSYASGSRASLSKFHEGIKQGKNDFCREKRITTCIWTCRSNPALSLANWRTSQGSWS